MTTDHVYTAQPDAGSASIVTSPVIETLHATEKSWHSLASLVCGLMACIFNALLFTAPIGLILGTLAVIFALIGWSKHKNSQPGLILGGLSFFILFIYLTSVLVILMTDHTISF